MLLVKTVDVRHIRGTNSIVELGELKGETWMSQARGNHQSVVVGLVRDILYVQRESKTKTNLEYQLKGFSHD